MPYQLTEYKDWSPFADDPPVDTVAVPAGVSVENGPMDGSAIGLWV